MNNCMRSENKFHYLSKYLKTYNQGKKIYYSEYISIKVMYLKVMETINKSLKTGTNVSQNNFIHNDTTLSNNCDIANGFNDYFINIPK